MRYTRSPVPNCSDNQGRSHAHEATESVWKKQHEEVLSFTQCLKKKKQHILPQTDWSRI